MLKNEIYDKKLVDKGIPYKRLGEYTTQLASIEHQCLACGTIVNKPPKKVLAGVGCKVCAIKKSTWSDKEYDAKILDSAFIRVESYINNLTEILHKCKVCDAEYRVRPASILQGHGCKYCQNRATKSTEQYKKELPSHVECLGEYLNSKTNILHKCAICANEWLANPNNVLSKESGCPECAKNIHSSKAEDELLAFIKDNYSGWVIEHDRAILEGLELDIVIPDLGLAFEYNGTYWHSEKFASKTFHLNKSVEVENFGYKLIHIFEDDWKLRKNIIKSRILALLGKSKRIYARACTIKEVECPKKFLEENHLQGYATSSINLGLYYEEELVALMTFGNPRFNSKYKYELIRYCSKLNTTVVGGASKILKYFREHNKGSIVSYGNRSWGIPTLYSNLNFTLVGYSEPNYRYYKGVESLSRYQCQKHKLVAQGYPSDKTEVEIMKSRGYLRVYDCGNSVWEMK